MKVRPLKASDLPALKAMAEASGFPYPELAACEVVQVVVDEDDQPLMAAGAQCILEVCLWCGKFERPLAKLHALKLLHEHMAAKLREIGYDHGNCFVPPEIERSFSRRLRSLGWVKNWTSFARRT